MEQTLAQLIDEITVDANDTTEQLSGFLQVLQDEIGTPASATVLGMDVEVTGFDLEGAERRGLVAQCRYRGARARSRSPTSTSSRTQLPDGSTAYRVWLYLPPFPGRRPPDWAWPEEQ